MRLERLEIAGFKSFSDRSELAFDRGRHRDCRSQRLRQEQRRRRHHVGPRRAERPQPARREDGGRHLQRQRRAQADGDRRGASAPERRHEPSVAGEPRPGPTATAMAMATATGTGTGMAAGGGRPRRPRALHRRAGRDIPSNRPRRRADSAAVSLRRERVPDRRRALPAEGHPRAADGHGPWRQGLRDHRAGQDRDDPVLAPDRPAPADRGSGRHHEVQGAPAFGGAQARGGAAEPDAHRRHRLRGRQAARQPEAPGGKGASLPAAARRAAALGEGAVCARSIASSRRRSNRRASAWPRRASAKRLPRPGVAEIETALGSLRIEAAEADSRGDGRPRTRARSRAGHPPHRAAGRAEPPADRRVRCRASSTSTASWRLSTARREPQRVELDARRVAAAEADAGRDQAASRLAVEQEAYQGAVALKSKPSRATSKRPVVKSSPR